MTENEMIVLSGADGRELKFRRLASIHMDESVYVVLVPAEAVPGLADNQALVFEAGEERDGMAALNIVSDIRTITRVYEKYQEMMLMRTEELARKKQP